MSDIEKLTQIIGSPRDTAKVLNITLRTYWNYKRGKIPERMKEHIRLLIKDKANE